VLTPDTIERIRGFESAGYPVLSVYVGLARGMGALRGVAPKLKEQLLPLREVAAQMDREPGMSLRRDIEAVLALEDRIATDPGSGVAIFRCDAAGYEEYLSLPAPVRDRAVVDTAPYIRPLDTIVEYFHRYCAVVIDRRLASIFQFYQDELESWEEMAPEEVRKSNYGGFAGYSERKVRARAESIALRHYRDTAARLYQLHKERGFDLILVGGPAEHVDGLINELNFELKVKVAGTFAIDLNTMTPAIVHEHCRRISADHDRREEERLVAQLVDAAKSGGLATLGLEPVRRAVNARAVATLVIQAGNAVPGAVCVDEWLVADADSEECADHGGRERMAPDIFDALATAVRRAGGEVRHVLADTKLAEHEVGAFLRFDPVGTS
jgi:peptide chain release factor subunit 1